MKYIIVTDYLVVQQQLVVLELEVLVVVLQMVTVQVVTLVIHKQLDQQTVVIILGVIIH